MLLENFPNTILPPATEEEVATADVQIIKETNSDKHWSRQATLPLIELRKNFDSQFKSTALNNDVVWGKVAAQLKTNNNFNFSYARPVAVPQKEVRQEIRQYG
jgi:hypothetical protein